MKILLLFMAICFLNIFKTGAQINPLNKEQQQKPPELLFEKSKKQKKTAWILLGAGAGAALIGYGLGVNAINNAEPEDFFLIFTPGVMSAALINIVGETAMVASVPFFIASGRNKKKAKLILKSESQSFVLPPTYKRNLVSFGIKVNL